jgi:hypothetical protein
MRGKTCAKRKDRKSTLKQRRETIFFRKIKDLIYLTENAENDIFPCVKIVRAHPGVNAMPGEPVPSSEECFDLSVNRESKLDPVL